MANAVITAKVDWFLRQNNTVSTSTTPVEILLDVPLSYLSRKDIKTSSAIPKGYYWFTGAMLFLALFVICFAVLDFSYKLTAIGAIVYISAFLSSLALSITGLTAIVELKFIRKKE